MSHVNFRQRNNRLRKRRASRFANNMRRNCVFRINNSKTINRIVRITTPQVTENLIANDFFSGSNFHESNYNFELLVLPAGFSQ
jgi:hypothetical protein